MAARCPRCGAKFRIPTRDEIRAGQLQARRAEGPAAEAERAGAAAAGALAAEVALGPATTEDEIEFFCPNDHWLHGPANLQGQQGTCPQCGAEFRIPSLDEWEEEVEELQESAEGALPEPVSPPPPLPPLPPSAASVEPVAPMPPISMAAGGTAGIAPQGPAAVPLPGSSISKELTFSGTPGGTGLEGGTSATALRQLLPALWAYRVQGASIEIQYGNGQRLHPDRFLAELSAGTHAVFADRAADGSYTLTAVAWHTIMAVVVRGIQELAEAGG